MAAVFGLMTWELNLSWTMDQCAISSTSDSIELACFLMAIANCFGSNATCLERESNVVPFMLFAKKKPVWVALVCSAEFVGAS